MRVEDLAKELKTTSDIVLARLRTLKLKAKDRVVTARGSSTDIIEASVRAYINALNKIENL